MPNGSQTTQTRKRKVRVAAGVFISALLCVRCHQGAPRGDVPLHASEVQLVSAPAAFTGQAGDMESLVATDPLKFLQLCRELCQARIRDYRCTFAKQELVDGQLRPEQETDVRFRRAPFSVDMTFTRNARDAARALYVAGKWYDSKGNPMAWARPAGVIIKTFIPKIRQPIHGARARKASRRSIDQFGFEMSLDLILKYSLQAQAEGKIELNYVGHGSVGGRPTHVIERLLPYTGEEHPYPDRLLVVHIDQEYLVPTACLSYADDGAKDLLGSYVYTDIELNPGYTDEDFDPELIGF